MDPDALRDALNRWVEEDVIDESTAARIRAFETSETEFESDDAGEDGLLGDRRVVVALALMGGALIAVGVGTFLLERWESIPVGLRALVLLGVPLAATGGAVHLGDRSPRTAHGLWLLAALFTGVTLFQLAELFSIADVEGLDAWLWLAWAAVAIGIGSGLDSRPVTVVGVAVGLGAIAAAVPGNAFLVAGFYGGIVYAAGVLTDVTLPEAGDEATTEASPTRFAGTLRWVGGAFAVSVIAAIGVSGSPPPITDDPGTVAIAGAAAVAGVVAVARSWRSERARYAAAPAIAAPASLGIAWALGGVGLDEVVVAVVGLACLLGLLLALVVAAVGLQEAALVNVATLGFVLGVGAFLVGPVADVTSGPLALVAAGLVLLGAGLGAERGRREVLSRMG
ncbi:putative membrane protein [Halorubrum alkaliphilum]|uniref:Putative membrane protein n=1 Tax=Halorubrum alkaliphilum TaxID=261290 RepID=A0A8T4GEN9_9EURY|nr:DUF2157 domain-containing protein [Halorubrum alkaliphilum]MBP1922616.1 putative membrane protein [Halorubrum alkaliphilum]